ncbi:purple acid phosphatase family protein [Natrialba sp. SSL1]|uniref:purple acid phosphatase family protein n=1 Tax=Natrialba sp. SSL1 TaxID=1869245 RepID=UPI0008F8332D|nr:metallophosphoesterase family protein [Natrialba sp. SSL1]OIB55834.1 hypothetical protein BBD46_20175 [Natrialba sp. SSL1]
MSQDDRGSGRSSSTRRRFLHCASLGTLGIAGCTELDPRRFDPRDRGPDEPESDFSTLIATWRGHDPATTMTLQWLTPETELDESVSVELSPEDDTSTRRVQTEVAQFGGSDLNRHRADVTDLAPDARYRIAIDGAELEGAVRTAPEDVTEPITFAEGGDVGTSSDVPPLHEQAAVWDPLFAVVGGDLAYADGWHEGRWIAFLEHWNEYMRSGNRLIPLVAAIGNHEVRGGQGETPDEAPFFYTLFDNPHREHAYWALDVADELSILLLDSNHTTAVVGEQTDWVEDALAERTDRKHLLAVYHVPIYPSVREIDDRGREAMRQHWVPLLDEYDVDVAFEHDDHAYKRTHRLAGGEPDPDGVLYLGDGAWGRGTRDVHSPDERSYLAVSESELHVIRVALSPDGSRQFRAVGPDENRVDQFDYESAHGSPDSGLENLPAD